MEEICGFGSPGEIVSLGFALEADRDVPQLILEATGLSGAMASVPQTAIDLYVVHLWDQAGLGVYRAAPIRVGELLLKDDRITFRDGFTRGCGRLHLHRTRTRYSPPRVRLEGEVRTELQAGARKQLWLSARLPPDLPPGRYAGKIVVRLSGAPTPAAEVAVALDVLPVRLAEPEQELMLWYLGTLDCRRPQHYVSASVFEAQLRDIYANGFRSVSLFESDPVRLQQAVDVVQQVGFRRAVVLHGSDSRCWDKVDFGKLEPIAYVSDELDGHGDERVAGHVEGVRAARRSGVRSMASLLHVASVKRLLAGGDVGWQPDVLSLYVPYNLPHFAFQATFPDIRRQGHHYYWQTHMEKPNTHRLLAGIFLWKSGARGISPYCYQHLPRAPFSPYDDFDEWEPDFRVGAEPRALRDHVTTYPARAGPIPTVQWRGLGEGLTDLRYLTTLDQALRAADQLDSAEVREPAAVVRKRLARLLDGFSLTKVEVLSETAAEPYSDVAPESFQAARREVADAAVLVEQSLERARGVASATR